MPDSRERDHIRLAVEGASDVVNSDVVRGGGV